MCRCTCVETTQKQSRHWHRWQPSWTSLFWIKALCQQLKSWRTSLWSSSQSGGGLYSSFRTNSILLCLPAHQRCYLCIYWKQGWSFIQTHCVPDKQSKDLTHIVSYYYPFAVLSNRISALFIIFVTHFWFSNCGAHCLVSVLPDISVFLQLYRGSKYKSDIKPSKKCHNIIMFLWIKRHELTFCLSQAIS